MNELSPRTRLAMVLRNMLHDVEADTGREIMLAHAPWYCERTRCWHMRLADIADATREHGMTLSRAEIANMLHEAGGDILLETFPGRALSVIEVTERALLRGEST